MKRDYQNLNFKSKGQAELAVDMVYCAYCGKAFTRKEHLERHIPSREQSPRNSHMTHFVLLTDCLHSTDTNVKPHRCVACQLSFARRQVTDPASPELA